MDQTGNSYWTIVKLSVPIAGIQLSQVALTTTDLLMMGLIDVKALAAGGLAVLLYNQLRTMCVGMVTGLGNLVAGTMGRSAKRTGTNIPDGIALNEVQELLRAGLLIAIVIALFGALVLVALSYMLTWFGQDPAIVDLARPFMLALAPGLLPMLGLNVLRQFAVGMHRPGSLLRITLVSIGVNALLNAIFIYGWLGLPRLGLVGIGLSTTFVQLGLFLAYLRNIKRDKHLHAFLTLNRWQPQPTVVLKIAKMGAPIALTYGSEAAITSVATILMGMFGSIALAASNVVNQLVIVVYQVNIGLSHGSSVLISHAVANDRYHEVRGIAGRTFKLSSAFLTIVGILYLLAPRWILFPFLGSASEAAVFTVATSLLWLAIAHQFANGSQNICIGLLRGLGDTKIGLRSTSIGYWLIGIPAMVACGYWANWGENGIWLGRSIGFGVTGLLLWRRFLAASSLLIQDKGQVALR